MRTEIKLLQQKLVSRDPVNHDQLEGDHDGGSNNMHCAPADRQLGRRRPLFEAAEAFHRGFIGSTDRST